MVKRPAHLNAYEFVVLSALRTQQLMSGCVPRLEGRHKAITMAQMEVSEGRVRRLAEPADGVELASSTIPTT